MKYERWELYKGYQISGKACPSAARWQSLLTVQRPKFQTEAMGVAPSCDSVGGAIDQALCVARRMIDTAGFSLQTARDDSESLESAPL